MAHLKRKKAKRRLIYAVYGQCNGMIRYDDGSVDYVNYKECRFGTKTLIRDGNKLRVYHTN